MGRRASSTHNGNAGSLSYPAEEEQVEVCQSFLSAKAKAPLEPQPEAAEEMAAA